MKTGVSGCLLLLLVGVLLAIPAAAKDIKYQMDCDYGKGAAQTLQVDGFTVTLARSPGMCHVSVLDESKRQLFQYSSTGIQVYVGKGVTAFGGTNAIIQSDTVPYKLFVISLGKNPRLVGPIENRYGFWFRDDCDGRILIWTADGAFQGDPDLRDVYLYDLFVPEVVMSIRGRTLVDETPKCQSYFDRQLQSYRSRLTRNGIDRFRSGQIQDQFYRGQVKGYILKITFDYLYTGREAEARRVLSQMWPRGDLARLWNSILKGRSRGVLRQTGSKLPERELP